MQDSRALPRSAFQGSLFPLRFPCLILGLLLLAYPALAAPPNLSASSLPSAPFPHTAAQRSPIPLRQAGRHGSGKAPLFFRPLAASSVRYAPYDQRKWARFVDPGERVPPLSAADKWRFWLREEVRPGSAIPALLSAGFGQLTNQPAYGSDEAAFGEKLGAAALRQASMRFFVDSIFPAVTGEDPRYFRKASGTYRSRGGWAAESAFINQRDDGSRGFNFSDIFGHLAASVLILAYYPRPSANFGMVMLTWGTSIAGTSGNNEILEFWPDIVNRWVRRRQTRELARHLHDNIRQ